MRGKGIGFGGNGEKTNVIAYQLFSQQLQDIWQQWNLRLAVLISLAFQIMLIFFASIRKRSGSMTIQVMVWSSYLLADWIAAFAVGLISSSQGENQCEKAAVNDELAAFWAPFLLLHLGGPDTITAFSLEDNELWIRHLLSVAVQVVAVGYVFIQSLPNHQFWLPTALLLSAGTIKYAERTRALYLACLSNLKDSMRPKPDPGPNYAQFMEEYSANEAASVPKEIYRVQEPEKVFPRLSAAESFSLAQEKRNISEKEIIQRAYWFYSIFRGLIVDHMFSFHERNESRSFFFSLKPGDAFKIMEVELNFMYDALYTKMEAVHHGFFGYFVRFVCSALLVAAFVTFTSHRNHGSAVHQFDIRITYALLVGAVILDFVSLMKLVFSDWTIALVEHSSALSALSIQPLLRSLNVTSGTLAVKGIISFRRRWCERLHHYNLISYCLKRRYVFVDKTAECFALKEFLDRFRYKTQTNLDDSIRDLIFHILQEKAQTAMDTKVAKGIYSSRGECTLVDYDCPESVEMSVSEDVEYDESVLMWHIATDICYHCCDLPDIPDENRTRSKQLSDYLLYLLIMQPKLMLAVAGIANIRFQDTCEEARKFFLRSRSRLNHREACQKLINVDTSVNPVEVKGDRSKSLLFDAVQLAKDLNHMVERHPKQAWEMICKVWLELLCYGASHCRGDAHAQQLRQGGELITFVWLLMAHFGLGEQFRIEAGHARAKLIVDK